MKPSMIRKLATLSERLEEINRLMSAENATSNMDNYRKITQEHAEITPIVEQYHAFEQVEADMNEAQAMLSDPDMKEFAQDEIEQGKLKMATIESARLVVNQASYKRKRAQLQPFFEQLK